MHEFPRDSTRACTHAALFAPVGRPEQPPKPLHASSQLPPAAESFHTFPSPPHCASTGGGVVGGGIEGGGGYAGGSGGGDDTPAHGQKRWTAEWGEAEHEKEDEDGYQQYQGGTSMM